MTVEFRLHSPAAIAWALRAVDDLFSSMVFAMCLDPSFVCVVFDPVIIMLVLFIVVVVPSMTIADDS
jgi:hypothetical protein